jgi:hypothetical protein
LVTVKILLPVFKFIRYLSLLIHAVEGVRL